MVGANHRDWNDPKVDELQILLRDIPQWKNIIFQYSRYIPYSWHRP
jgi:hypothetical protein